MFDLEQFEERAAIMEFDGGLSRFEAETLAAKAQGVSRWEAINAKRNGHFARGGNNRQADERHGSDDLPAMQPAPEEQNRPMSERVVHGRGHPMAVPPLRAPGHKEV